MQHQQIKQVNFVGTKLDGDKVDVSFGNTIRNTKPKWEF